MERSVCGGVFFNHWILLDARREKPPDNGDTRKGDVSGKRLQASKKMQF
jgi:hypothetical protein